MKNEKPKRFVTMITPRDIDSLRVIANRLGYTSPKTGRPSVSALLSAIARGAVSISDSY